MQSIKAEIQDVLPAVSMVIWKRHCVGSDKNLTFAYLKLLEERAKDQAEDKIQKIQLDIEGIREQLRKDREEGSDAE